MAESPKNEKKAYMALLPLKLLLLKYTDPAKFSLIDPLMDHKECREREKDYWMECQEMVVDRIRLKCGQPQFDPDEIHRMDGILDVNAFEIYGNGHIGYRGLFPLVYIIFCSC